MCSLKAGLQKRNLQLLCTVRLCGLACSMFVPAMPGDNAVCSCAGHTMVQAFAVWVAVHKPWQALMSDGWLVLLQLTRALLQKSSGQMAAGGASVVVLSTVNNCVQQIAARYRVQHIDVLATTRGQLDDACTAQYMPACHVAWCPCVLRTWHGAPMFSCIATPAAAP